MSEIIRMSRRALLLVLLLTQFSIVGCGGDAESADSISVGAKKFI